MFSKKWLSVSLTTVLLAANLSMPFASVSAMASEAVTAQEYSTADPADDAGAADEQAEETDASGSDSLEAPEADSASADVTSARDGETEDEADPETDADAGSTTDKEDSAEEEAAADEEQESGSAAESSDSEAKDGDDEDAAAQTADSETNDEESVSDEQTAEEEQSSKDTAEEADKSQETSSEEGASDAAPSNEQETEEQAAQEAADTGITSDIPETAAPEEHPVFEKEKEIQQMDPADIPYSESDNEEAFAGYVNREMELTGDLRADEGDISKDAQKLEKNYASSNLKGNKRKLYDLLGAQICNVAAGKRTDTHFVITAKQLGLSGKKWTASDLGLKTLVDEDDYVTDEAWEALEENVGLTYVHFYDEILSTLLADYPYDLYWFDKTESTLYSSFGYYADWENNQYVLKISPYSDYIDCYFPVCAEYSASGETGTYEADSSIGTAVSTAYNNANAIVSKYAGYTDYNKMDAYRREICSRVSYNDDAAENSYSMDYGNPWQLIWVFDGNSSTNVVCEGYSKAFQYLCDLSSWNSIFAECISVTGYMDGGGHMWNIVSLLDGRSYLVDVTNCDSGSIGSGNSGRDLFLVGTGDPNSSKVYATGNIDDGYTFEYLYDTIYTYDSETRIIFDDEILTLAAGRVDKNTSVKPAQNMSASDLTVTMFDTISPSVKGNTGTLQYSSDDTSVFTVNATSGKITPVAPGQANLEITAQETNAYRQTTISVNVTVKAFTLTQADTDVTISSNSYTYTGTARKPSVTKVVDANGRTLTQNTDFTVSYSNNVKVGTNTAKVKITGTGKYTGTVEKAFTIKKASQKISLRVNTKIPAKMTTKCTASGARETSKYTFASSNKTIATVSSSGIVTGKKAGTITLTVTTPATANYNAGKATIKITIISALKKPGNCHFIKWNNEKYSSCRIGWNATANAKGYQTLLSWTDGSHASWKNVSSKVLYRDCSVAVNHVSQMKVRAYFDTTSGRQYGPWSNVEYITPSPTDWSLTDASTSSSNLKAQIRWNIIYGCNGYNVFLTTNPNSTWYWNQSTAVDARATSAVISKYRGSKLKKYQNYYVRIVTRRQRNGVFCTVPMPKSNTYIGYFYFH